MNISHDICIPHYCSSFISFFLLDKAKRRFVRFYFAFFLLSSSYLAVSIGAFLYFLFVSFRLFPPESTFSLAALTVEPIILSREPRYKCAISKKCAPYVLNSLFCSLSLFLSLSLNKYWPFLYLFRLFPVYNFIRITFFPLLSLFFSCEVLLHRLFLVFTFFFFTSTHHNLQFSFSFFTLSSITLSFAYFNLFLLFFFFFFFFFLSFFLFLLQ
ncbi:unnamed protein product [Acanthosepion pharaonis]|uniref:Uncharacterized protein n=1 Tax=Acanthosepion pharaonis TaxID=158019 RepID=A0A812CDG8_ACAPH|nr:unnamed protein product [Sepia pharaonis]